MYIFTPNTLIESAKVNANFDDLEALTTRESFNLRINTGTGSRSTTTSTSYVVIPGIPAYTYTAGTRAVKLFVFLNIMAIQTGGGAGQIGLAINGTVQSPRMYITDATNWDIQPIPYIIDVAAGASATITAYWKVTSGTLQTTNSNTDSEYPSNIVGWAEVQ